MSENKYDAEKPRLDLVPPALIEAVGIIRTYGSQKYGSSDGWRKVAPERYRAAMMRHLCRYLRDPSGVDGESGYPHLWHLACNVAFLIALETPDPQLVIDGPCHNCGLQKHPVETICRTCPNDWRRRRLI